MNDISPRLEGAKRLSEVTADVAFTIVHSMAGDITKAFKLNASCKLTAIAATPLSKGTAHRTVLKGTANKMASELATWLTSISPRQAIIPAPPPTAKDIWPLTTLNEAEGDKDVVARSPRYFRPANGPALLAIDFDFKTYPPHIQDKLREVGNISKALASVFPLFGDAACVSRPSTSTGIRIVETGEVSENTGAHWYFFALDGQDASEFIKRCAAHLALAGWIWGEVSEAGLVLYRGLFDLAASSDPSRLFYEADPKLDGRGLERVKGARDAKIKEGGFLDTRALPPLTEEQTAKLEEIKKQIARDLERECRKKRAAWEQKRIAELIRRGKSPEAARKAVTGVVERHTLSGDFDIKLDNGDYVGVSEILENPEAFHRQTCADPLEPDYRGGRNIAVIFSDAPPFRIHSLAHGGIDYRLEKTPEEWFEPAPEENTPRPLASKENVTPDDFPEPWDIFGHDDLAGLASVPSSALPLIVHRWALSESRRKGTSLMFPAMSALTVIAAAIGNSVRIQPREFDERWTEPAALWTVLVASPGRRKSPTMSAAIDPLRALDGERGEADEARHARWAALPKPRKGAPDHRGPEPRIRRFVVDDATLEKQVRIHRDNPRGLLRTPDELTALLGSLGAYKKSGDGDRGQMLSMFDGKPVTVDRVTTGTVRAECALMSVLAGTQPAKIEKLTRDLGDDGFLQRFLFILDDGEERRESDEAPDAGAAAEYEEAVRYFACAEHGREAVVRMTNSGHQILREAEAGTRKLLNLPGASDALKGHLEKYGKILPRLTLVFHALAQFELFGSLDVSQPVLDDAVRQAVEFSRYLLRHSLAFYARFYGHSPAASEARMLAGFVLTKPERQIFTVRDLSDARKELRGDGRKTLYAAMRELEDAGWCRVNEWKPDGPASWRTNPRVHSRFVDHAQRESEKRARQREAINAAAAQRDAIFGAGPEGNKK